MSDAIEDTSQDQTDQVQEQPGEVAAGDHEIGDNPVFEPIRQSLGLQYETIKPELLKIEKNFNDHVTRVNGQYEPWKQFADQGVTPDQVTQAFAMLQKLNESPEEIYQALGNFLQQEGRLPTTEEIAEAVDENDGDEYESDEARQIAELRQKLEDMQALSSAEREQAAQQAAQEKADREVEAEYSAFKDAHPDLSDEDWREIQLRHLSYAQMGPEHFKSLEDVGKEYFSLVERIRSAPRPNDTAPRLPGAGGVAPAPQTRNPAEFSRQESQDALVALLTQGKQ